MKNFGQARFHARTMARGEDDGGSGISTLGH